MEKLKHNWTEFMPPPGKDKLVRYEEYTCSHCNYFMAKYKDLVGTTVWYRYSRYQGEWTKNMKSCSEIIMENILE